ncbi:unnamed protein product [Pleuronectes platessa]|uniref:Polysaccharide biosynthesis domain-containing protein n=1 Tax=Pleuronectes platessa TaxID=8262 RepID=A0A9N7YIF8_PLEPL|nr:unnamed protein product [Pleuronectes platessa]
MASDEVLASLGVGGAVAAAHALSLPADAYGNDPRLEAMWAMKAYNHAEVYFNLISSVDPKFLKLTKLDDEIYSSFRETFKDLDIKLLKTDDLKSNEAKERWRPFCNQFEGLVEDFQLRDSAASGLWEGLHRGEHPVRHQGAVLRCGNRP